MRDKVYSQSVTHRLRGASQPVTLWTRHSPKSYDELTGGWNTVLWRVDRRLKRRAVTAVTS